MTSAASSEPGYTPLLDRLAFAAATPLQAADAFDSAQQALRRATEAGDDPALHRAVAAAAVLDDRIGGRWGISGADLVREEHTLQRATLQGPEDHPLDDAVAVILRDRADRGWTERGNPGVDVEALSAAAAGRQVEVARDEATGQPRLTGTTSTSDLRVELDDPDTVADWLRTTREVADPLVESALRRADDDPRGEASLIIDQATSTEDLQGRRHSAIVLVDPDAQDAAAMAYDSAADAARVATVTAEGGDDVYAGAGLEDARDAMVAARPRTVRAAPGTTRAPASAARLPQPAHGLAQQARQRNDTRQLDVSQNARHVLQEAAAREATYAHHRYDKPKTATPQSGQETR